MPSWHLYCLSTAIQVHTVTDGHLNQVALMFMFQRELQVLHERERNIRVREASLEAAQRALDDRHTGPQVRRYLSV